MNPRVVLALSLTAIAALVAVVLAAANSSDDEPATISAGSKFEGSIIPEGVRAPDFTLRNQDGDEVTMRDLRGKPVIVTFLYTTCEETCPIQAQTIRGALDQLGHDVPALAVAVDPPRDDAARAKKFLTKNRALGRLDFVLGTRAELKPVWNGFHIQPQTVTQEHQARFTLVDKRGFQRIGFPGGQATPERLAHDVALLERE